MTLPELLDLIKRYDAWVYGFIFAYCFGKTGPLPMLAGFAAAQGALKVEAILPMALLGAIGGGQARFWMGRLLAPWVCKQFPELAKWLALAAAGVERYATPVLALYRYVKGSFAVVCVGAGTSLLSWVRFTATDLVGATLWVGGMVGTGWGLGKLGAALNPDWAAYIGLAFLAGSVLVFFLLGQKLKATLQPHAERIVQERLAAKDTKS